MVLQQRVRKSRQPIADSSSSPSVAQGAPFVQPELTLTPYALRLPKAPTTGDPEVDAQWQVWHSTMQKIISWLTHHPDDAAMCWARLQTGGFSSKLDYKGEKSYWDDTVVNVMRLPKYWQAQQIVNLDDSDQEERFTKEILDKLDGVDSQAVPKLWRTFTLTSKETKIPMLARNSKALCGQLFANRINQVGLLTDFCKMFVDRRTWTIDWARAAPYRMELEGNKVNSIVFRVDNHIAKVDVDIDVSTFEFRDVWCMEKALALGPTVQRYPLVDFFPKNVVDKGPRKFLLDKKGTILDGLAQGLQTANAQAVKELNDSTIAEDVSFVGASAQQKRKVALETAQQAATAKQKRLRTTKLVVPASASETTT